MAKSYPQATKYVRLKVLDIYVRVVKEFPELNELLVSMPDGHDRFFNYEDVD